jgi:nucleotide-binding universal stress UspA family protein
MGAYGHSRIRRLLLGSTTRHMLHRSRTPLLLLR